MILCVCVFGYSAFQLYSIFNTKQEVKNEVKDIVKEDIQTDDGFTIDWASLKKKNSDIIAWIYVPDCDISYPVVQTTDNSFYLSHTFLKKENYMGAVFLDYNSSSDFSDSNSVVYGHSVDTGGMFTDLKKFKDEDFYKNHQEFYLFTEEANYICHVMCFAHDKEDSMYYETSFMNENELLSLQNNALYFSEVNFDTTRITLSTCDLDYGDSSNIRYILVGCLEKTDDVIVVE